MSDLKERAPRSIHRTSARGFPYEEIALNNALRVKLGGGIPEACLHRAERALASLRDQYEQWVLRDIAHLEELADQGRAAPTDGEWRKCLREMQRLVHDMRGPGGTFGYPLVSSAAASLVDLLKRRDMNAAHAARLVRLHSDLIERIVASRIEGDGGKTGQQILKRLRDLTAEMLADPTDH